MVSGKRVLLLLGALGFNAFAWASTAPTADGTLTVGDRTAHLSFAYAWRAPNPRKPEESRTFLLLSDRVVPPAALGHTMDLLEFSRRGELSGVQVEIDADGNPLSGWIFSNVFPSGWLSVQGSDKLVAKSAGADKLAGRLFMPEPRNWGAPNTKGISFSYSVNFETVIAPAQPRP